MNHNANAPNNTNGLPSIVRSNPHLSLSTMPRKRKRSAYSALSPARVLRYQPHHTSRTYSASTLHVTPAPPESITDFDSTPPDPAPTPPPTVPTLHSTTRPPLRTPSPTHIQQLENNSPLIIRAADIASVQVALGFTPDTPAHSTIYLGVQEQQHVRNLIHSPHQGATQTPQPPRRLSLGSTVTPIPLHLESPEKDCSTPSPSGSNPVQQPQPHPFLCSQHPLPSPITSHQHIQVPSPPSSPEAHPCVAMGDLIDPPPLSITKTLSKPSETPIEPSPFVMGTRKPLAPLNNGRIATHKSIFCPPPLFTTGKGKLFTPLNSKNIAKAATLLSNNSSSASPPQPNNLVRSLFSTGKGKQLLVPKYSNEASAVVRTPLSDKTNLPSIFTSGSGKRVFVSSTPNPPARLLHRPPPSPHTPSMKGDSLKKTLFREPVPPTNTKGPSPSASLLTNSFGKPMRHRIPSRTGLKTTPFRQPRRVAGPKETNLKSPTIHPVVPRWNIPKLSKKGWIYCASPPHTHHHQTGFQSQEAHRVPSFFFRPDCLQLCLQFVFQKHSFGRYECLPKNVVHHFQLQDLASFSVGNVLSWTRTLFPFAVEKPASCFGSAAWTRMSYSLAVWKLARFENDRSAGNDSLVETFLSAANLVREFLRRIDLEWHSSRQPHLLRMMRQDSSPASHVVLRLSGLELGPTDRIVLLLSDGWYLARALADETVQRRVWSGNLHVGDKISIVGASLQEHEGPRQFFFGDGDELGSSVLCLFANGVRKARCPAVRLGAHRSPCSGSLRWIKEDGGKCPTLKVVVLRSYPVFYLESLSLTDTEDHGKPHFVARREEGEDQARERHEENICRQRQAEADQRSEKEDGSGEVQVAAYRDVRAVKEFLICGARDDPCDAAARKLVRVYNTSDKLQALIKEEGQTLFLSQVIPKRTGWTCKPDGIRQVQQGREDIGVKLSGRLLFPRKLHTVSELRNGAVIYGDDFDGVFLVLYVAPHGCNRFAYLTSAPTESINVLALQLSESDSECLPRALQLRHDVRPRFPIIGIRDATYCYRDSKLDILHANATMRTSFLMSRTLSRMRRSNPLRVAYDDLECQVRGKEPHLEVLRDAVISFASGNRSSVSAYFTSTQDM